MKFIKNLFGFINHKSKQIFCKHRFKKTCTFFGTPVWSGGKEVIIDYDFECVKCGKWVTIDMDTETQLRYDGGEEKMHAYLIISSKEEAFVFTNVNTAKEKEKELGDCKVYEWMDIWCRPLDFTKGSERYDRFDESAYPWRMLIEAHKQGNWNGRCKYREELFTREINERLGGMSK